ncbi:restriction endonuclease subunit S [Amycolatopsis sp. H20-H5]|uniref:restriction endonuclease subunit S n=1 Tax=Amycolatopsis sp. H20-H5 TaxID=3046309 RepID=UPI002DBC19EE|nr:restriction endonuclease subunit S [Amycolatopsis sp. H20-H5]MEC3973835.1 restriction endonuclease subunit S [Amycolatopsis sp. H20-H5]
MNSLIGGLPEGWRSVPLGDLCEVIAGPGGAQSDQVGDQDNGVAVIAPRNIVDYRIKNENLRYVPMAVAGPLKRYRLRAADVVCVRTGTLGRHALVGADQSGWLLGSGCLRLRSGPELLGGYLDFYLRHPEVLSWVLSRANRTTIPSLNARAFAATPVAVPPLESQREIVATLEPLDRKLVLHERLAQATRDLREGVLRMLLATDADSMPARHEG